jgi:hypothetical protein
MKHPPCGVRPSPGRKSGCVPAVRFPDIPRHLEIHPALVGCHGDDPALRERQGIVVHGQAADGDIRAVFERQSPDRRSANQLDVFSDDLHIREILENEMVSVFRLHAVAALRNDDALFSRGKLRGDQGAEVLGAFDQHGLFCLFRLRLVFAIRATYVRNSIVVTASQPILGRRNGMGWDLFDLIT